MIPPDPTQSLIESFRANDPAGVAASLAAGANPNTLFLESIAWNRPRIALLFLEAGASIHGNGATLSSCIPWRLSLEKNRQEIFQTICDKNPDWINPASFDEGCPINNPWVQMALHPLASPVFHKVIALSTRLGQRLPPELSDILAQEVGGWAEPVPILEALLLLINDDKRFLENVALGACIKGAISGHAERESRPGRVWALEKGASFMSHTTYNWRTKDVNERYNRQTESLAVLSLPRFPFKGEGGLRSWVEKWGPKASTRILDTIIKEVMAHPSSEAFSLLWEYRDPTIAWSMSAPKKRYVLEKGPLPHEMVHHLFAFNEEEEEERVLGLLKTIVATGHELHALNSDGETAIHSVFLRHEYIFKSPLNDKRLAQAVKIFQDAGLPLSTTNRAGEAAVDMARRLGGPAKMAIVAQWEAQQLNEVLSDSTSLTHARPRM